MMTRDAYKVPPWATAILFWRKVLAVESKGVPAIRPCEWRRRSDSARGRTRREMNLGSTPEPRSERAPPGNRAGYRDRGGRVGRGERTDVGARLHRECQPEIELSGLRARERLRAVWKRRHATARCILVPASGL